MADLPPVAPVKHHHHYQSAQNPYDQNGKEGTASWYDPIGKKVAENEIEPHYHAQPGAMTAAHRSLPFGTHVIVTNEKNGRKTCVRVDDRGPYAATNGKLREIDVNKKAAQRLDMIEKGTVPVRINVVALARAIRWPPRLRRCLNLP